MARSDPLILIGGGTASAAIARNLRAGGYAEPIVIVSQENRDPYERPPLSKACLTSTAQPSPLLPSDLDVDLRAGTKVTSIDKDGLAVVTARGDQFSASRIVVATGGRARRLAVPGADLDGVHTLRTYRDSEAIRDKLKTSNDVVVVGAGVIGLEVAAAAISLRKRITVVEQDHIAARRFAGPSASQALVNYHEDNGINFRFATSVEKIEGVLGVERILLSDGKWLACDLLIVGIGIDCTSRFAEGLGVSPVGGIAVDERCRTGVNGIYAAGDIAAEREPSLGRIMRRETIHNAEEHGRRVAADILDQPTPGLAVPYGWSDQGELNIQQLGNLASPAVVTKGSAVAGGMTIFHMDGNRIQGCVAFNRGADIAPARRLIERSIEVKPELLADEDVSLRALLKAART